jgi:MSHA biogenesis protein MshP
MNRQYGFGAIAAIVILVILAVLAASIVSLGTAQQTSSALDLMSAKAWQAARAGNEWGLYKALHGEDWDGVATNCNTAARSATLNLVADTGFQVSVSCASWLYNEGESSPGTARTLRVYRIQAVACPAAPCPSADGSGFAYVERSRAVIATD